MSDEPKKPDMIYERMAAIMAEVPAIAKDDKNQQQGYKYRGIELIVNAVKPLFAKHGVFMTFEIVGEPIYKVEQVGPQNASKDRSRVVFQVRAKFYTVDGSFVTSDAMCEAWDTNGDKACNKAMTAGQKYAILQVLMIPTMQIDSEQPDYPRDDYHEPDAQAAPPQQNRRSRGSAQQGSPEMLRAQLEARGIKTPADQDMVVKFLQLNPEVTVETCSQPVVLRKLGENGSDLLERARAWRR